MAVERGLDNALAPLRDLAITTLPETPARGSPDPPSASAGALLNGRGNSWNASLATLSIDAPIHFVDQEVS